MAENRNREIDDLRQKIQRYEISLMELRNYENMIADFENKIALRTRPRPKTHPKNDELWAWGNNGFWAGTNKQQSKYKKKHRLKKKKRKKKKSLFKIFGF